MNVDPCVAIRAGGVKQRIVGENNSTEMENSSMKKDSALGEASRTLEARSGSRFLPGEGELGGKWMVHTLE